MNFLFLFCLLTLSHTTNSSADEDRARFLLDKLLNRAKNDPEGLAADLRKSPLAAIVPTFPTPPTTPNFDPNALPTVLAHGMGDSCFNSGMESITKAVGQHVGSYSVCIPTGNNSIMDTINGFIMNMDKSVEVFTEKIRANKFINKTGFNAIGFSQGNSLIRGYIQKYNDPPVNVFISVHGTVKGVSGFPQCNPSGPIEKKICEPLAELLGDLAYLEIVQKILFQADYFDDPTKRNSTQYMDNSQIADWNNEGSETHALYKTNFLKTNKYVMIKALKDTMVFPNENEWWGGFADGGFETILSMKDTDEYKRDTFGLASADKLKKIFFDSTKGNHLDFTTEQLYGWIDKYF